MPAEAGLWSSLRRVLLPTPVQVFLTTALAVLILGAGRFESIVRLVGLPITKDGLNMTNRSLASQLAGLIDAPFTGNMVLIVFWAAIGMVVYLVCWSVYAAMVDARNEMVIHTAFANRGHWRGSWPTLFLKLGCAVVLVTMLIVFLPLFSFWQVLANGFFAHATFQSFAVLMGVIVGLAVQLYALYTSAQLTFLPWYRT